MKMKTLLSLLFALFFIASCNNLTNIAMTSADFTGGSIADPTQEPTPEPTTPPVIGPNFDDMADCDNQSNWGGYWYTYNDHDSPNNGDSAIWPTSENMMAGAEFVMSSPGSGGAGDCAARLTGNVTTTYQYGFIGMGVATGAGNNDLTVYNGISITVKGDGKTYSIKFKASSAINTGFNDYKFNFLSSTDWNTIGIPFTSLTQELGWGTVVVRDTVLADVTDLQFQTVGQPHASIDIWVDNIIFF